MKFFCAAFLLLFSSTLWASGEVKNAFARGLIPGRDMSAAFFSFKNTGADPIVIVGASSSAAKRVEIHTSMHEDGMMKMRELKEISIAGGEQVVFAPGGNHLMLFECDTKQFESGHIMLQLIDSMGKTYSVHAPVYSAKDMPKSGHHGHH